MYKLISEPYASKVCSLQSTVIIILVRHQAVLWQTFLAVSFGLGIFLRFWQINLLGLNSDEAVYVGQAAAIARAPIYSDLFPVFRAHPLLFQFFLAVFLHYGVGDLVPRLISAMFGIGTIVIVYQIGKHLYNQAAGYMAALIMALMPYHIVVSRQVLLDGPMVFFASLTLLTLVYFSKTGNKIWIIAAGAGMGLTFLTKETGIILLGAIYAFLALSPEIRIRISSIFYSLAAMVLVISAYPLSLILAGGGGASKTEQYLVWQLFRKPNHSWEFYPTVIPPALGIMVILSALIGLWLLRNNSSWREKLLLAWILVPTAFFQLWPTKGFQYLLPISIAVALLASRAFTQLPKTQFKLFGRLLPSFSPGMLLAFLTIVFLTAGSIGYIFPSSNTAFLAGSGGVRGGREVGQWIRENTPENSTFMTIGPSMANIIKFYGHREAYGLSVSPNPLHRNPSYQPINNPDYQILMGEIQYLVWDSYSARRTSFFADKFFWYVRKYNGRLRHLESIPLRTADGTIIDAPLIIIFEVTP